MSSRLNRKVEFEDTEDPVHPFRSTVDGEVWQVRRNDVTQSANLYSLVVGGRVVEHFERWPAAWQKPVRRHLDDDAAADEQAREQDPSKLVEPPPLLNVSDLFAALEAEETADLADAEREARRLGKEEFSMARLEELFGGEAPEYEQDLRRQYYVRHTAMKTLAEFAAHLQAARGWD